MESQHSSDESDEEDDSDEVDDTDEDGDVSDIKEGPNGKNGRIVGVMAEGFRRNTERKQRLPRGKPQTKNTNPKFRARKRKRVKPCRTR